MYEHLLIKNNSAHSCLVRNYEHAEF